jgi:hypothetical protein
LVFAEDVWCCNPREGAPALDTLLDAIDERDGRRIDAKSSLANAVQAPSLNDDTHRCGRLSREMIGVREPQPCR